MAVNDSTPVLESAENAQEIALKIAEAIDLMATARNALSKAVALVKKNEKDPDFIMGNLQNVLGALELAHLASHREGGDWAGYAAARNRKSR